MNLSLNVFEFALYCISEHTAKELKAFLKFGYGDPVDLEKYNLSNEEWELAVQYSIDDKKFSRVRRGK